MPRKKEFSANDIVMAAFELVRKGGWSGMTAAAIAGRIGCSTMPIYSHFKNLEELEHRVMDKGWDLLFDYEAQPHTGDVWLDQAIGYVNFALEEKQLFRCLLDGRYPEKQRFFLQRNLERLTGMLDGYDSFGDLDRETIMKVRYCRTMLTHGLATAVNVGWTFDPTEDILVKFVRVSSKALIKGFQVVEE